ncbi:C45 family autoproteolytic acyltransferase/hydolase [Mesonia maritima]|uniref:Tetratricopeptide (TPR) repeat protein n=3 Tax=Mesonia maritima TaxID=1793873 RepID=A0ABU1K9C8_9FLAO|nr:C45 family autoproteolytic acyltransferase/hydolase [Mesonia maritima]MDR6301662.1 tetratricopeptide (TPR) repeat protein [Mesonia maritima]
MRKFLLHHKVFYLLFLGLLLQACGVKKSLNDLPHKTELQKPLPKRIKIAANHFQIGNNSLKKNDSGLWELYVEGNPLERGYAIGSLSEELIQKQERVFMDKIFEHVNSGSYQKFLSKIIAWYNRKLYLHVNEEFKEEIYGISRYNLHTYDEFAKPYVRSLYLHGAHDIGHALQDLMLVGCTSFAAWDEKTSDGQLLVGRNFDFYAGDQFSEEKIIAFINPTEGHKFMMYTWPGFIGAVSGMNEYGLTVTINAGKSQIPLLAKTPISLVTREILQYAKTIDEAIEIAKRKEVFVSESIMVSSASDKKAILIEVSPNNFGIYEVENSNHLSCSNHFQSEAFADDKRNLKTIANSHTTARFNRMEKLIRQENKLTPTKAVEILRDKKGVDGEKLGYGNELAINQLLAHHSIIFKPEEKQVWVSTNPYQLGKYIAYDLDEVFSETNNENKIWTIDSLTIQEDPFLNTEAYKKYEEFRSLKPEIEKAIQQKKDISTEKLAHFIQLNPEFWETHFLVGKYYYEQKNYKKAIINFKQALRREVTTVPDRKMLKKYVKKSYRKL